MPAWLWSPGYDSGWGLILGLVVVAGASWAATGLMLRLLIARRIYDEPNHRSSHAEAKPRGGGLAVILVVLVAWVAAAVSGGQAGPAFWLTVAGAAILAAISWADDLKPRPASLRFGVQVAAVALAMWSLDPTILVFQGLLPLPADRLLTALLWLWFINLFNFMDGIDGISAVETITIGGGLAVIAAPVFAIFVTPVGPFTAAVPAAAALGFLFWNWAPSRIFLGDVGSVPLGYLLGWLLILTAASGLWASALILPLYYLADASLTLAKRALRREKLWQAHREHFYQRAVQRGFSHAQVAGRIAACNAVLMVLALFAAFSPAAQSLLCLALALLAVAGLLFMLANQTPPAADPGSAPPQP